MAGVAGLIPAPQPAGTIVQRIVDEAERVLIDCSAVLLR
jgi:hypothetical protein